MKSLVLKAAAWLSDLRVAIVLLLVIAACSGLGTAIPQGEPGAFYHERYDAAPWLGVVNGDRLLSWELDHLYTSNWFLVLLAWLGLALLLCSLRRQWPALRASLRWLDYTKPRQLSKLAVATSLETADSATALDRLESQLQQQGWAVRRQQNRLAARRGVIGRVGPLLVHTGLIVFKVGAVVGAFGGQRLERFLAPGRSLELLNPQGDTRLELQLDSFAIQRDPAGRPEQFSSQLRLRDGAGAPAEPAAVSVNHPLRHRGITVYQADWGLAAVTVQLGQSPLLQLPLQTFPELGDQVWGLVLPTRPDGSDPVLLALQSELGPVEVYGADSQQLGLLTVGGESQEILGLPLRIADVMPASGLLIKRDPGCPWCTPALPSPCWGGLSLIATRQLWAISESTGSTSPGSATQFGGLADELPKLGSAAITGAPRAR